MYVTRRRRLHLSRIIFFLSGVLLCCIYQLTIRARLPEPWLEAQTGDDPRDGPVEAVGRTPEETVGEETHSTASSLTQPATTTNSTPLELPLITSVASPPTAASTTTNTLTTANTLTTTNSATTMATTVTTTTPTTTTTTQTTNATTKTADVTTTTSTASTTELSSATTTNRTVVCIFVEPNQSSPTPTPTPTTATPMTATTVTTISTTTTKVVVRPDIPHAKAEYPEDIFSVEDRRRGWVVLHIFGMIYMFVALAIVCDEFFVPTLGVITDKLEISDDVAGATFMAAGGSAPELFTSLIGVFISHSNVGIGTIVGSAVFNILFVIGMCALFSREMLHLTWWPLFRDVSFYIMDLIMLIIFFLDNTIMPWESAMLIGGYTVYVIFMKFNVQIEQAFKSQLMKHKSIVKVIAVDEPEKDNGTSAEDSRPPDPEDKNRLKLKPSLQRGGSSASLHNSTMRSTIFQLMIHTLDPLGEVKFKDKAQILNNMARGKPEAKTEKKEDKSDGAPAKESKGNTLQVKDEKAEKSAVTEETLAEESEVVVEEGEEETQEETKEETADAPAEKGEGEEVEEEKTTEKAEEQKEEQDTTAAAPDGGDDGDEDDSEEDSDDDSDDSDDDSDDSDDDEDEEEEGEGEEEEEEEVEEPLSLEWPETPRKQATYLFLLPIVFPLWLTVPDVRNPASRRFFVITFVGSIMWIAVFSYLMVWWAHQVGETVGISEEIMGLTILAAGTSIPDLITSVIVARKGLGDMAVSSSVGSNIFDITVGLPVPWLMYSMLHGFTSVPVSSNGLFCAIVLLFLMLLFVIISIGACKWKMNKALGLTMFFLYFIFLVLSVMLEDRIIVCPVSI